MEIVAQHPQWYCCQGLPNIVCVPGTGPGIDREFPQAPLCFPKEASAYAFPFVLHELEWHILLFIVKVKQVKRWH